MSMVAMTKNQIHLPSQGAINSTTNRLSIINNIIKKNCQVFKKILFEASNLEASGTLVNPQNSRSSLLVLRKVIKRASVGI